MSLIGIATSATSIELNKRNLGVGAIAYHGVNSSALIFAMIHTA
jgi:hypothetical protein